MSTETLVILSNIAVCLVSVALAFVTAMAITKDDRKFILDVLSLKVVSRKRHRKVKPEVPTAHSDIIIAHDVPESDRERFLRAV